MTLFRFDGAVPEIDATAYVAPNAIVIGRAFLAKDSSVWFNAVLRGDTEPIRIGVGSNVQEGAVLHTDPGYPLLVGNGVTVGHQAMLHGCSIGDGSLIGIQAVVLNGAVIGRNCLVGAGALVTEGKKFPDNSLIVGSPARILRQLTAEDVAAFQTGIGDYVHRSRRYANELEPVASAPSTRARRPSRSARAKPSGWRWVPAGCP